MRELKECKKCNHQWLSALPKPKYCSKCHAPNWDMLRKPRAINYVTTSLPELTAPGEKWRYIQDHEGYLISSEYRIYSMKSDKIVSVKGNQVILFDGEGYPKSVNRHKLYDLNFTYAIEGEYQDFIIDDHLEQ